MVIVRGRVLMLVGGTLNCNISLRSVYQASESNIDHSCICYETRGNCVTLKNNIIIIMNEQAAFWEMMGTLNGHSYKFL